MGNPVCPDETDPKYCTTTQSNLSTFSYSTPNGSCSPASCGSDLIMSPDCACAYPYMGILVYRVRTFSDMENASNYKSIEQDLMLLFQSQQLPVDSVSLTNPTLVNDYLEVSVKVFPLGQDHFNRTGIYMIGYAFSSQFSAYSFIARPYEHYEGNLYDIHIKLK